MRNFMNARERELLAKSLACCHTMKELKETEFISPTEKRNLTTAINNIEKLQDSVLERMDVPTLKKLKNLLDNNKLGFYSRSLQSRPMEEDIDDDIINRLIEASSWAMDCLDCNRKDFQNCDCYRIWVAVGKEGKDKKGDCPYK